LLLSRPYIRLAPLYDIASLLPYEEFDARKVELTMKIGGEYKLSQIGLRQWQKFAQETRLDADQLLDRLIAMAKQLPDEMATAAIRARREGLGNRIIERLADRVIARARYCEQTLSGATESSS
jgi:serine/threonine-protein kinase HipA